MIAYFDCFSGISGDMTLGAFIDLGVDVKWLETSIRNIPLDGFDLQVSRISRSGIGATNVCVNLQDNKSSRNYTNIRSLIEDSPLKEQTRQLSLDIFEKLAVAESGIHGCPKENVHFHEVGGIDAIVDIVGTALCIEYLEIDKILSSKIPLGTGFVKCRHGKLPVPSPATTAILKGVPVYGTNISNELVTPTGAAIISTIATNFDTLPDMVIEKVGYGAGKRDLESVPNLLRIMTGHIPGLQEETGPDTVMMIETCIDDMNPEIFGFLMDRLFEDGALDVCLVPVYMKKNRPGTLVKVLSRRSKKEAIVHRILSETTSIGVRYYDVKRSVLERESVHVDTSYGKIKAKKITDPALGTRIVPEYDVLKKIALEKKIPLKVLYDEISVQINDKKR